MLPLESNKNLHHEIHHVDLLSISSNQNSRKSLKIKINYDILSHPLVKIFEITLLLNTKLKIKSFYNHFIKLSRIHSFIHSFILPVGSWISESLLRKTIVLGSFLVNLKDSLINGTFSI